MLATLTNVKNNTLLFNPERKMEFLEEMVIAGTIKEKTSTSYARIFSITQPHEEKYKKDLAEFNVVQLEKIFIQFGANNRNTLESYGRIISSYLNWSVKKGYAKDNLLSDFRPSDFEKYLSNNEVYLTEKQLRRYEDRCENYQDAVILRLLFEGVGGKQLSEVRNLKKSEVDVDNCTLYLSDESNESGRFLKVDQRTIDLLEGAMKETQYRKRNGMMEATQYNNIRDYTDLVENEYVLRSSITRTEHFDTPVDKFVIYRRIESVAKSLGIEDLTAKFVQRSGMIHRAHQMMKEDGQLSLEDLKRVADRYGIKSYHNLKGFLTTENVMKVYGETK